MLSCYMYVDRSGLKGETHGSICQTYPSVIENPPPKNVKALLVDFERLNDRCCSIANDTW